MSLDVIKERRRPEARKASRDDAIREAKEKKAKQRAEKARVAVASSRGQIQSKQGAKGAQVKVVAAKSR